MNSQVVQGVNQGAGRSTVWALAIALCLSLVGLSGCGGGKSSAAASQTPTSSIPAPVPLTLSAFTPISGAPGTDITVTGTGLSAITAVTVGGVAATFSVTSATQLVFTVPANAVTGKIEISNSSGGLVTSTASFTVSAPLPLAVNTFSPSSALRGQTITVTGTSLSRVTAVIFGGGISASVASHSGNASLTAVVPIGAVSGPITVSDGLGGTAVSTQSFTVVETITVTPQTYTAASGTNVTLSGSGLLEVSGVTVSGVAATVQSASATQLVFTVPAGVGCGAIVLTSSSQPSVNAGSVALSTGCGTVRNAGIEVAQLLSQVSGEARQHLVPGKETWVRVFAVSETANTTAPTLQVRGFNGSTPLGTVTLSGPALAPQLAASSSVPQSMRVNSAQSYNAELPASWITSGLRLRLEIDPSQQFGPMQMTEVSPEVGTHTYIDLVVVPLVSGSNAPSMPNLADVLEELERRLPLGRDRIRVAMRAPYSLSSVNNGVDTSSEWVAALNELENLRRSEAPSKHYYGMVMPMVSAGTAGIGYVNVVGASNPALSSLGWDASRTTVWRRTMSHELGHNFSRPHAPCGGVASPDVNYPYAGGLLGTTPLFDSVTNSVMSPSGLADIMGYCNGSWFSDYNVREIQRFLEARPQPVSLMTVGLTSGSASSRVASSEVLMISGVIDDTGVQLAPVRSARGVAPAAGAASAATTSTAASATPSEHSLRLTMRSGAVLDVPLDSFEVDHAPERHFFARVAHPGEVAAIEVRHGKKVLPQRSMPSALSSAVARTSVGTGVVSANAAVAAKVVGQELEVTWNPAAAAFVTVTLVTPTQRQVLTVDSQKGRVSAPLVSLPPGGSIEVSLSEGLNARTVNVPRP